jgi:ferritin-like metal-binding protein YciE
MTLRDPKQVFVMLLSNVRHGAEHATKIYHEMSDAAEHPEVKEALQARAFISEKMVSTLDECFRMIDEKPMESSGRLREVFLEEFRRELAEIETPEARHLYILAKAHHFNHLRVGEYVVLVEAADMTGHYGVGTLLASCLADKIAFVERTRHLVRKVMEGRIELKKAA